MKIVAHRGASRSAPENTLAAIRAAIMSGADGVEIDVRLTRDGEAILMHDPDLLRTTGDPRPVAHCLFTDLASLEAGSWFGPDYVGEPIPRLDEALAASATAQIINLDVKSEPGSSAELAHRVAAAVMASTAAQHCWISSTDPLVLSQCHEHTPDLPIGRLIEDPKTPWQPDGISFLSVREDLIDTELVQRAAERRLQVWAWTVNDPWRALELSRIGVAIVITDMPAQLRAQLSQIT